MAKALTVVFAVLGVTCAFLIPRAARRDADWLRHREPGALDFVPIRPKAKRIHLGTRLATTALLFTLAAVTSAKGWH